MLVSSTLVQAPSCHSRGPGLRLRAAIEQLLLQVHYNSIYPSNAPPEKVPRSKVLGSRKLHRLFHRAPQP